MFILYIFLNALPSTKEFFFFNIIKTHTLSCSFFGNNFTSCNYLNSNHSISKQNVFLFGDQFTPSMGSQKEFVPVVRTKDPSFDTLKETLLAQKKEWFGKNRGEGCPGMFSLLSY